MKKIDQNSNINVLQFLSQLQLEQFSNLVESTYKDPKSLFNNIVDIIEPEERKDLVVKAEIDLYSLSIEELVHLAYTEGKDARKKISTIYSLLIKDFPIPANHGIYLENKERIRLVNPGDTFTLMRKLLKEIKGLDREREHLWAISINSSSKIIEIDLVTKGAKETVDVSAKEIFCGPLKNRACSIILVHNHPSENVEPSKSDIEVTNELVRIGNFLDIPVRDHIIISSETYYSFKTNNMLDKTNNMLESSTKRTKDVTKVVKNLIDTQLEIFKEFKEIRGELNNSL